MVKMIVGLGNPEQRYLTTRHNVGWLALDSLENKYSLNWKEKFKGAYSEINQGQEKYILLKPLTYMNKSGESVVPATSFFKVAIEDVLVIHDELDLPFGTIAYKVGGGLAGHNGLKSIAELCGSQNFARLRIGIGRPQFGSVSSYVLSDFDKEQAPFLDTYLQRIFDSLEFYMAEGLQKTIVRYNKKNVLE